MSKQFHINNNHRITLRTLREMVDPTTGQPLPTAKALREGGSAIVASASIADGLLTVYQNGFYIYKTESGTTVYAVDRCAGYVYEELDASDTVVLEDEEWTIQLALKAEDRLERNNNEREKNKRPPCRSEEAADLEDLPDSHDFIDNWLNSELVDRMLACLTEKQRQVVRMYFLQSKTQCEVAVQLGISQPMVIKHLNLAKEKMKKYMRGL